ncbi:NAD-dependent epimerase/dehydratase family protein [Microbacterium sp.]|uniref:NAD-dependent epimerase/dehydratase family protein n=1 Tax=Microbacterium sp. TaxID=51671 RepID=UPI0039E4FCE6
MAARRVLILGGTGWLGRHVAAAAVADGAEVVCLARGESGAVPEGARLVRADRRDADAYRAVSGHWDEVVELAYEPTLVTSALRALAADAAHWTLVSTVSVYARADEAGADESAELVEPADPTGYADAKVAAERVTLAAVGDRLFVSRPGLIAGPGDPSDRFGYWPARFRRGGTALAPILADRFVQVIDVRDLALSLREAGSRRLAGVVNAVGTPVPMAAAFAEMSALAGFGGEVVEIDDDRLLAAGVTYWAGPSSLPLWLPAEDVGFVQRSGAAYLRAGGRLRPFGETIADVLTDEAERGLDRPRRCGLTAAEEAETLRLLRH